MEKVNKFRYKVNPGERITIKVTPTNFSGSAPSVEAVIDDAVLPNTGTINAPVYKFNSSDTPGETNRVIMEFTFQFDSPDNAVYKVVISGRNDVGCPCGFTLAKTDQNKSPVIRFRVKDDN